MLTLGRQNVLTQCCVYKQNVYICFSQVFIYESLFQCLRILEVNLKLEVRMSFKIQLTELSSLHINLYIIFLITDWQHCTSNRVHSKLVLSYFYKPINNFKIL